MVERILISNGYLNMRLKRPRLWPKWVSWSTLSNLAIAFKGAALSPCWDVPAAQMGGRGELGAERL